MSRWTRAGASRPASRRRTRTPCTWWMGSFITRWRTCRAACRVRLPWRSPTPRSLMPSVWRAAAGGRARHHAAGELQMERGRPPGLAIAGFAARRAGVRAGDAGAAAARGGAAVLERAGRSGGAGPGALDRDARLARGREQLALGQRAERAVGQYRRVVDRHCRGGDRGARVAQAAPRRVPLTVA